jgi:hypothetical protein
MDAPQKLGDKLDDNYGVASACEVALPQGRHGQGRARPGCIEGPQGHRGGGAASC